MKEVNGSVGKRALRIAVVAARKAAKLPRRRLGRCPAAAACGVVDGVTAGRLLITPFDQAGGAIGLCSPFLRLVDGNGPRISSGAAGAAHTSGAGRGPSERSVSATASRVAFGVAKAGPVAGGRACPFISLACLELCGFTLA